MGGVYKPNHAELPEVRVFQVTTFDSYLIFYYEIPTGIRILRVVHGARDLDRIIDELKED